MNSRGSAVILYPKITEVHQRGKAIPCHVLCSLLKIDESAQLFAASLGPSRRLYSCFGATKNTNFVSSSQYRPPSDGLAGGWSNTSCTKQARGKRVQQERLRKK